jgi:hypothetical protein
MADVCCSEQVPDQSCVKAVVMSGALLVYVITSAVGGTEVYRQRSHSKMKGNN